MATGKIIAMDQAFDSAGKSEDTLIREGVVHGFVKVTEAKIGEHVGLGAQLPFFSSGGGQLHDQVSFEVHTNDSIEKFAGSVSCAIKLEKTG